MRLVDNDNYLAVQAVLAVVVTILDDLVVDILENEKHLRIGYGRIAVGKHGLEVKYREVLIRRNG